MNYDDIKAHFGTEKACAAALGIEQPSVNSWKKKGIPWMRQMQIQELTEGKLKADPLPMSQKAAA